MPLHTKSKFRPPYSHHQILVFNFTAEAANTFYSLYQELVGKDYYFYMYILNFFFRSVGSEHGSSM